jgi:hypothetical protein
MNLRQGTPGALFLIAGALLLLALVVAPLPGAAAQSGGQVTYGARIYGTLDAATPTVSYSFLAATGDFAAVTVDSWTGTLDARLTLIAPNGQVLAESAQNTLAGDPLGASLTATLPDAGVYVVLLDGDDTTGDYLFMLDGRPEAAATELVYGQRVTVTVASDAPTQSFRFEAGDCPTTLIVDQPTEGEPFTFPYIVRLRDARGHAVAQLRGGSSLADWTTIPPRSGRYEVEVLAADPSLSGAVDLLVTCVGDNPDCPPGGAVGECPACPPPDDRLTGGGCPDVNLNAAPRLRPPNMVDVTWDAVAGAVDYAVVVTGITELGDRSFITRGNWSPGDPLAMAFLLPFAGPDGPYAQFVFTLEVITVDGLLCTNETRITVDIPQQYVCPDLNLQAETGPVFGAAGSQILTWNEMPGATGYVIEVYITPEGGVEGPPVVTDVLPAGTTTTIIPIEPGWERIRFVLRTLGGPIICDDEVVIERQPGGDLPCAVVAALEFVPVHVGPGNERAIFRYMESGVEYVVIGQATDSAGQPWWQLDKTQFPGHEAVISLWVYQASVTTVGDCSDVPPGDVPDLIIPVTPDLPGGWLPCGSCDTCGHPANECVTAPDGACLWDPATCLGIGPTPEGDDGTCYTITAAVDVGPCLRGNASIVTQPNCDGGRYRAGTSVTANASGYAASFACRVVEWTGCGASGSGPTVTFTATSNCTVTARLGQ